MNPARTRNKRAALTDELAARTPARNCTRISTSVALRRVCWTTRVYETPWGIAPQLHGFAGRAFHSDSAPWWAGRDSHPLSTRRGGYNALVSLRTGPTRGVTAGTCIRYDGFTVRLLTALHSVTVGLGGVAPPLPVPKTGVMLFHYNPEVP